MVIQFNLEKSSDDGTSWGRLILRMTLAAYFCNLRIRSKLYCDVASQTTHAYSMKSWIKDL